MCDAAFNQGFTRLAFMSLARRLLLLVTLCTCMGERFGFAEEVTAKDVILHIQTEEDSLRNLTVHSSIKAELWNPQTKEFVTQNENDVVAFFTGKPGSLARVNFLKKKMRMPRTNSYLIEKESDAYNGKFGTKLFSGVMDTTGATEPRRGMVLNRRPEVFVGVVGYATGWQMSIFGFGEAKALRLSEMLGHSSTDITAKSIEFGGQPAIELSTTSHGGQSQRWVFDPHRGFALLRYERLVQDFVFMRISVDKLAEAAPGIFYPIIGTYETMSQKGPIERSTLSVTSVVANDPKFDESVFTIRWPAGTVVQDTIKDVTYTAGADDKHLDQLIREQVQESVLATQAATLPATAPAAVVGPDSRPSSTQEANDIPSSHVTLWLSLSGLGLAAAIVIWWGVRRKKFPLGIILVPFAIHLLQGRCRAEHPEYWTNTANEAISNCGLNVSLFSLQYLSKPVTAQELSNKLHIGLRRDYPCSLLEIKDVLLGYGLAVNAFKEGTVGDLIQASKEGDVIIFHLDDKSTQGHYMILLSHRRDELLLVDPGEGAGVQWVEENAFRENAKDIFTGTFMVVSKEGSENYLPITAERSSYHAHVKLGSGRIKVPVPLSNPGNKEVIVTMLKGDCGCFKGGTPMPFTLEPYSRGILTFEFERDALGVGTVRRQVVLFTGQDPQKLTPITLLDLTVDVESPPPEDLLLWYPHQIDLGVIPNVESVPPHNEIRLHIPRTVQIISITPSSGLVHVHQVGNDNTSSVAIDRGGWVSYDLSLAQPKGKNLNESITIRSNDQLNPTIIIPITGEIR
jgi:hypothetical protein